MRLPNEDHDEPAALHEHAADNLRFIRSTMERASVFTAVPGWGTVAIGVTAVATAWIAGSDVRTDRWLTIWLTEAALATLIATATILTKSRSIGFPVTGAPMRRFLLAFLPPLFAGAFLTAAIANADARTLLPSSWLLLYGTAVMAGGAMSVRVIPFMGLTFMLAGIAAFFIPIPLTAALLGITFGGMHIIFGLIIARRYGG